jgi:hypothetical protein
MHREILANEAVLLAIEVFAGQRTAMQVFPSLRDFRKEFVVRAADDVDRTEAIVLTPAAADREVPHLAIEHGQRRRGMFDEELEDLAAFSQLQLRLDRPGNVGANPEHSDDLPLVGCHRIFAVIDPAMGAVDHFHALDPVRAPSSRENLLVPPVQSVGHGLRAQVINRPAHKIDLPVWVAHQVGEFLRRPEKHVTPALEIHVVVGMTNQAAEALRDGLQIFAGLRLRGAQSEIEDRSAAVRGLPFELRAHTTNSTVGVAEPQAGTAMPIG